MLAHAALAGNNDVNGWQDTKWGMTPDEAQKAVGRPMSFADLAKVCDKACDEGAALELDDYNLNNQHFVVRLWFDKSTPACTPYQCMKKNRMKMSIINHLRK